MQDKLYESIIDGMTWSYSRLEAFESCRYGWYLKYMRDVKDDPGFYTSYGSFFHALLEGYYKGELPKSEMKSRFLSGFSTCVTGKRPSADIVGKYIKDGVCYLESFTPIDLNIIAVEKEVSYGIGELSFTGFIDILGERDGRYYIVDHKSRNLKPRSNRPSPTLKDAELDKMLRQLYLYSAAVKEEYGEFPAELCFNCFRTGVYIKEMFCIQDFNKTVEWANKTVDKIKKERDFPPTVDYFYCKFLCGVRHECCYAENI